MVGIGLLWQEVLSLVIGRVARDEPTPYERDMLEDTGSRSPSTCGRDPRQDRRTAFGNAPLYLLDNVPGSDFGGSRKALRRG